MLLLINAIAIFNILLLFSLLLFKKPYSLINHLLAFIVLTPGFAIVFNILVYLNKAHLYPVTMYLSMGFNFLWAPAFYLYVQLMTCKKIKWKWVYLVHFIPFLVNIFFALWFSTLSFDEKQTFFSICRTNSPLPLLLMNNMMIIQVFIYLILSVITILKYKRSVKNSFSEVRQLSLNWLIDFIIINVLLGLLAFIPLLIDPEIKMYLFAIPIASNLSYIFIVYKTMTRPAIFSTQLKNLLYNEGNEKAEVNNGNGNHIQDEILNRYSYQLEEFIMNTKVYRDSELNIKDLADKLQIPAYILSQTINRKYNKNFFEFINAYRVEEAKRLLVSKEHKNLTIDAIAFDCGFGSRASFYNTFKKFTKMNPSEFKKGEKQEVF